MRLIDLKTAATEIHQAIAQNKEQEKGSPFCFMVGAGISHPPIPLAFQVEQQCKLEAAKYSDPSMEQLHLAPIDAYSHWFEKAYPQPDSINPKLKKAPIFRLRLFPI